MASFREGSPEQAPHITSSVKVIDHPNQVEGGHAQSIGVVFSDGELLIDFDEKGFSVGSCNLTPNRETLKMILSEIQRQLLVRFPDKQSGIASVLKGPWQVDETPGGFGQDDTREKVYFSDGTVGSNGSKKK